MMNVVIPGIDGDTKEENAESPAHIDTIVDSQWRSKVGFDFV